MPSQNTKKINNMKKELIAGNYRISVSERDWNTIQCYKEQNRKVYIFVYQSELSIYPEPEEKSERFARIITSNFKKSAVSWFISGDDIRVLNYENIREFYTKNQPKVRKEYDPRYKKPYYSQMFQDGLMEHPSPKGKKRMDIQSAERISQHFGNKRQHIPNVGWRSVKNL